MFLEIKWGKDDKIHFTEMGFTGTNNERKTILQERGREREREKCTETTVLDTLADSRCTFM